jgi:hypothetical protein
MRLAIVSYNYIATKVYDIPSIINSFQRVTVQSEPFMFIKITSYDMLQVIACVSKR